MKLDGMLLEDSGELTSANRMYTEALKLSPNDPDLLYKVGLAALLNNDAATATRTLTKYTTLMPRDEDGFYYLAQAYHRGGDDVQALAAIQRAASLAPKSAPIQQKLGELLCSSGDNTQALTVLQRAEAADPALPRIHYDLAVASFGNQDLDQARGFATQELATSPNTVEAQMLLAEVDVKLGDWTAAVPLLQSASKARPHEAGVLLELGHCQLELHQPEDAIATLHRALALDPTQPLAHFFLSRAYAAAGNKEEARHEATLHQRLLQEISFSVSKAQQQQESELRAKAATMLEQHHEDEALKLFASRQAAGTSPAGNYVAVGATYLSMNDAAAAKTALDHALQLDPKTKGAHTYLGILALQANNLSAAGQQFEAELQLDPNHPLALAELGEVQYRRGDWKQAIDSFTRSKTSIPRFLFMLTDSYFKIGNTEAADVTAESLAAYAHDQPEVLSALNDLLDRNGQHTVVERIAHPGM